LRDVSRRASALTLLSLLIAVPAWALDGRVIDARSQAPIANAEVTIVGQRGSVRTGADGRFEWALPATAPLVFVIILPGGVVSRPIRVKTLDEANRVTLAVEAAIAESVDVSGSAPAIDVSAGVSTSLVTAADITLRHPITVGDILENIPGVTVISEGQSATPAIRGLARGRTSIMVDGSRASSERRAGANASFLDPGIVERVEVARGPASVAYGSDAMGGVIAVRTRRPDYSRPLQVRFAGTVGDGLPEVSGNLDVSAGYGRGAVVAGVRSRELDSHDSPTGPVPHSDWRDRGVRLRWEHATASSAWSIGWQTDQSRDIGRPRSDADVVRVTTPSEDSHRLTASFGRKSFAGFDRVRLDGLLGSISQQTNQDRLPTSTRARSLEEAEVGSREFQLRASADRNLGGARFQFGADLDGRHGLESTDTVVSYNLAGAVMSTQVTPSIENAHRTNAGVFTQADVQAASRLRLSGGIRADVVHSANTGGHFGDREVTHSAVAGSAAATFVPVESLTLTGQLSRGFREPMLIDRFYRGPVGRGFIEGNPDLEPETSLQVDVVARYDTGRLVVSSAFYDYRISNLIERYQAGSNSFFFRNRSAARIRGAELEARASLTHAFTVSLTAQSSRGRDDEDGTPLDDVAPRSVSVVTRHSLRAVSSYLRVTAFASHDAAGPSEVPTPGYWLADAGAAWRISRQLQIVGTMRNLLNDSYYSSAGPRWVYAPGRHGSMTVVVAF
jgi:outer membrane receptor protein involved in Fe transport